MMKKILFFTLIFYLLAILQSSFLIHFSVWSRTPNIALLLIILINIFESSKEKTGIYLAFLGGFIIDIFSGGFIGLNILIFLIISLTIKFILKKYVQIPLAQA